jgi:hypothetical protein
VVEREGQDRTSKEGDDRGDERSGESGPSLPIDELALTITNLLAHPGDEIAHLDEQRGPSELL